nr:ribonuclease H-like domain, reverse transcriptase, RNA-dependent DNA polymerase [Tanacetum cinerariifolium]
NYTVWAIKIKVILEAHGLWKSIEPKENTKVDDKKDKATTALLYQALTEDDDDTVDAFTAKLNGYATKANELGKTLDESLLVRKLLDSTPDRFIHIVASIEQTSDLDEITLDEITGKLEAFEERIKLRKGNQENLLFAQGEHSGKGRRFSKRGGRSNFSRGNWQNNRNKRNSKEGKSNHKGNPNRNKSELDLSKVRCYKCHKLGYLRKDFRGTSTTEEQSNLILEEDDEPSLLMTTYETEHEEVLLNEGQIQPGKYASGDASMWYLDNGASNHMTGTKSHFKDIGESVSEVVRHAIYILNRVPTRALIDKTPYEALYNRKPNFENLRIFGCTAYAKITTPHLKKLDDRSIPLIYLRVEEGSKACRLYDPIAKKKHVSRYVRFMETKPYDWDKDKVDTSTQDTFWTSFVVDGVTNENTTPVNIEINDNIDPDSPITPSAYTYSPHSDKEQDEDTISSIENSENGFDHIPVKGFKDLMEIYQNTQEVKTEILLFTEEEPRLKWVFKTKRDANGNIIKYKARLVAKRYVQEQGIDFDEVFAPLAQIETVRLILALEAYHGWQVHHLDVKLAFLHGDLKKGVYVIQPEGFVQQGNSRKVYKLTKALYGVRQAPRAWNVKLDQTLKSLYFKKCNLEQVVYTKRSKNSTLIVGVYVDDLIITCTLKKELEVFKSQMEEKLEMSDLGLLAYYLGIEVTQTRGEITIKQTCYINKILKETSMMDSNDAKIPMDLGTKLVKVEDGNSVDVTYYRSLIGSLRYFLHTRPDLSYSVGLLSRFMQDSKDNHLKAIKQQPTVALSSCESEFIAATRAACQALWLKRLISELTGWEEKRITLKVDNILAIALVKNLVFHRRSKHIDIRYHFIHECVENRHINVEHINGELQRADILTKALPRLKFMTMRQMLGVQDLGRSNDQD